MEDVLAVYERPLHPTEPVVCLDEKPVTLHAEVRSPRPATPGHIAKRDSEYARCGTANVFCAVEPKAGRHFTWPTPDRSADRFAIALFELAMAYSDTDTIHLVMDNLNTHHRKSLVRLFGEDFGGMIWDRFTIHYTPKHGSWLNQAEIEISLFARQCLGKRRIGSLRELKAEARAWNRRMNKNKKLINWTFTRTDARKQFGYASQQSIRSET
jgi:transposase